MLVVAGFVKINLHLKNKLITMPKLPQIAVISCVYGLKNK